MSYSGLLEHVAQDLQRVIEVDENTPAIANPAKKQKLIKTENTKGEI